MSEKLRCVLNLPSSVSQMSAHIEMPQHLTVYFKIYLPFFSMKFFCYNRHLQRVVLSNADFCTTFAIFSYHR